jgi:ribosomal protein S17
MSDKSKLKVGDYVQIRIVGFATKDELPYQVESIDGDKYIVVQTEGTYQHRLKVKKEKLRKL